MVQINDIIILISIFACSALFQYVMYFNTLNQRD